MQGKFYDKQKEEMIRTLICTVQCSGMVWNSTKIKSGWQSIISGQTKYWLWTWIALDQTVNTCLWALMTIMMGNDDTGCPKKSTGCPKKYRVSQRKYRVSQRKYKHSGGDSDCQFSNLCSAVQHLWLTQQYKESPHIRTLGIWIGLGQSAGRWTASSLKNLERAQSTGRSSKQAAVPNSHPSILIGPTLLLRVSLTDPQTIKLSISDLASAVSYHSKATNYPSDQ